MYHRICGSFAEILQGIPGREMLTVRRPVVVSFGFADDDLVVWASSSYNLRLISRRDFSDFNIYTPSPSSPPVFLSLGRFPRPSRCWSRSSGISHAPSAPDTTCSGFAARVTTLVVERRYNGNIRRDY